MAVKADAINKKAVPLPGNSGTTTYPLAKPFRVRSGVCPDLSNCLISSCI